MRSPHRGHARGLAALAATALVAPVAMSGAADAAELDGDGEAQIYIVQLAQSPLASYEGGTDGIPATTPDDGEKIDVESSASQSYADLLVQSHERTLSAVDASSDAKVTDYTVAFNGFAARLTGAQAAQLKKVSGVANVWENEVREADTITTPDYLGLRGDGGVWADQFGGPDNAGSGVVVGVLDTGIAIDNPSFAALPDAEIPEDWAGSCDVGEDEFGFECNTKVIGAQYYGEEFGNTIIDEEYVSPRDRNGHGSHTAGTSAGNNDVPMEINGTELGAGSGMAPAAQIAVYKALWQTEDGNGSGTTAGLVAGIDDAVADGVDIINYSVSGSSTFVVTPDELAFLGAADAGVLSSTSAGNSGDTIGESSVAHNSPWTMTVAASTHNRGAEKTVTLGNEDEYDGVGVGDAVGTSPLIYAADLAVDDASEQQASECWLDIDTDTPGNQPAIEGADGHIVVCDRGTIARVDKSATVDAAGGIGMVLANVDPAQSLNADFHSVPTIHVNSEAGDAIKAYVADATSPTAAISAQSTDPVVAPEMAGFSSYGPALAGGGDLLKPDVTAPGVDVIAAYHGEPGEPSFDSLSGTSMAAPHVAGVAALMRQKHPDWSPMAIKSAMMTTARTVNTAGDPIELNGAPATALNYGAGEIVPAPAYNPGLVYDAGLTDWYAYACAIDQLQLVLADPSQCESLPQIDPSDLNYPSISIGELAGEQTITRTVTSVADEEMTYTAQIDAPEGTAVTVNPTTITVPPGGEATYEATITRTTAPVGEYTFGELTWASATGGIEVTSPIAVQPVAIAADDEITEQGRSGSHDLSVVPGYTGQLEVDVDGLTPSEVAVTPVEQGPTTADATVEVEVPEGTKVARMATFDDEVDSPDIDLYIKGPDGSDVGTAATGSSEESFTVQNPEPGTYTVEIDLFAAEEGRTDATVPLHTFAVTEEDAGNMTVTPASSPTVIGQPIDLTMEWSDLELGTRYMGALNYSDGAETQGTTLVSIDAGLRVAGADRFATAAELTELYPDGVDKVYVANGNAFADALTGAAPAAAIGPSETPGGMPAPVLLVKAGSIPDATAAALENIEPESIVVLGGDASVEPDTMTQLEAYADEVERIGGADRYETSALISAQFDPDTVEQVYVASGEDGATADALAGGAIAGRDGAPVLLVRETRVPDATADALADFDGAEVIVLGGPASVNGDVYNAVGASDRLSGEDRYGTSVAIASQFEVDPGSSYVASGEVFPDALTASTLAGFEGVPVLLTEPGEVPDAIITELNRLNPDTLGVVGGPATVEEGALLQLKELHLRWRE